MSIGGGDFACPDLCTVRCTPPRQTPSLKRRAEVHTAVTMPAPPHLSPEPLRHARDRSESAAHGMQVTTAGPPAVSPLPASGSCTACLR